MLRFNLPQLSLSALKKAVADACSPFGVVKAITIYPHNDQAATYRYAFVQMKTRAQVKKVVNKLGEIPFTDMAVIRLEQTQTHH